MSSRAYTACIVAAGRGERAGGGLPKQFRPLAGGSVLSWSVKRFVADPHCRQVIVAHAVDAGDLVLAALGDLAGRIVRVEGGATRSESVRRAVEAASEARVFVHDAARPLLGADLLERLTDALDLAPGAAPALAVADALVRDGAAGIEPVDRSGLWRMQTPQAFHRDALLGAFAAGGGRDFPDEVSLARAAGMDVALVPGDEANFKLTWPDDFERAERLIAADLRLSAAGLTVTGSGFDVHRLAPGEGVHLCGVFIPCPLRLIGHSDADAGLHAITDALLGAAGLGDIGEHFPPTDNRWKGADSAMFLEHAVRIAAEVGVVPVHCDVTLICEKPKIGPHKAAMKQRVAALIGLSPARVNIKATTTEKLGFTGRGEGLAAEAVVTARA